MSPVILIVAVVALFVAIAVFSNIQARKRREALQAWAAARGLTFSEERVYGLDEQYPDFDCLAQGSNRYAYNTMAGALQGRRAQAFDYHYETHSTDSKGHRQTHHHHFSAVILESSVPLKPLFIRPEGVLDHMASFFGFDDINFESAEFSRRFYVKAPDRKWAYDVIHARTMEFLLASPPMTLRFAPRHVIAYTGATFDPAGFEQATAVPAGVLDRLPEYVVQQQGGIQATGLRVQEGQETVLP